MKFGYYVDLASVKLDDKNCSWIHAMPHGKYKHPVYGEIVFDSERTKRFASNVKTKVRGIDPDIDYDHKAKTDEAAGWVKDADSRPDGLWLLVDWTPDAAAKIAKRAYRYFSPEFVDEWEDSKGNKHKDVLLGGGITNRPFLKDLLPVNLSELSFAEHKKEFVLDPKALRQKLGLPEDATDEQVAAKVDALTAAAPPGTPTDAQGNPVPSAPVQGTTKSADGVNTPDLSTPAPDPFKASETDATLKKLAETNPTVKALLETQAAQATQLAEVQKSLKLSEVTRKLGEVDTSKLALTPVAKDKLRDLMMELPVALSDKVYELCKLVTDGKGVVTLGEVGTTRTPGQPNPDSSVKLNEEIRKLMATDPKMNYADAFEQVLRNDPEIGKQYLQEVRG